MIVASPKASSRSSSSVLRVADPARTTTRTSRSLLTCSRRPLSGSPGKKCCVQLFGLRAPDRAVALLRCRARQCAQCLLRNQLFDQWEQLSLLEPHMGREESREVAHWPSDIRIGAASHDELSERGRSCVQALMLEEGLDNQLARLFGVGDARKQQFLLLAKVWHHGRSEKNQERRDRRHGVRRVRATAEAPGRDQGFMVVMRERDQRPMPFHSVERTDVRRANDPPEVRTVPCGPLTRQ